MEEFINNIISTLKTKRVDYADVRVVTEETEGIVLKNGVIEAITHNSDTGFGVRVLKEGAWGFSSSNSLKKSEGNRVVRNALNIARASARIKDRAVQLAAHQAQSGTYSSKVLLDPFNVSLSDKLDLLFACDKIMGEDNRIKVRTAFLKFVKRSVQFASTANDNINQQFTFSGGGIKVYALNGSEMQVRSYENFHQAGYEFINSLDLIARAPQITRQALMLLSAKPCPDLKTTVIIDANQMALQVHESCGHPAELDRVLGAEASYAGTSFLTLEKLNSFRYGSACVNIVADATVPGGLGTFCWDDEGTPGQRFYLIKEGIFTGYLSSRETAPVINTQSSGAMRAAGWNRIPLIRMTNINLEPGTKTLDELIGETKDGIFMTTNKSWSIDDKRLNFQFSCEFGQRIENGKLTEVYKNPTYADITPQFWNRCDGVANRDHWQLFGLPNCGKGEPGQIIFVGHGTAAARFQNVQVGIAQ